MTATDVVCANTSWWLRRLTLLEDIAPLRWIEYGVSGNLIIIYPKPYSMHSRGTAGLRAC